uniref:uncharacterized protein LOC122607422 isoform X2 n=1 Tax=Erigeron canadensis TaxID=72917 RepID=UPI001CB9469E|nr:uncharacterized protein LOC122607422 isoform X2 [Erigeron canadensis]
MAMFSSKVSLGNFPNLAGDTTTFTTEEDAENGQLKKSELIKDEPTYLSDQVMFTSELYDVDVDGLKIRSENTLSADSAAGVVKPSYHGQGSKEENAKAEVHILNQLASDNQSDIKEERSSSESNSSDNTDSTPELEMNMMETVILGAKPLTQICQQQFSSHFPQLPQLQYQPLQFSQSPQHSQSPQNEQRKKSTKKIPWNNDEEMHLAECWLAVSEDPKVGKAQTINSFWYRVLDIYNDGVTIKRTKDQCSSKWRDMHLRTKKFNEIYSSLVEKHSSGLSDYDILIRAHELYESETGQAFKCLHIWNFVKDKQKWLSPDTVVLGRRNKKRNQVESSSSVPPIYIDQDEEDDKELFYKHDKSELPPNKSTQTKSQRTSLDTTPASQKALQIAAEGDEMQQICRMKLELAKGKKELIDHQKFTLDMDFLKYDTTGMEDADKAFVEKKKYDIRKKYGIV